MGPPGLGASCTISTDQLERCGQATAAGEPPHDLPGEHGDVSVDMYRPVYVPFDQEPDSDGVPDKDFVTHKQHLAFAGVLNRALLPDT